MRPGKSYFIVVLVAMLMSIVGCTSTKLYTFNALEPASVDLSTTITKIGIINESSPTQQSEFKTRLEQILSSKDNQLEKDGVDAAISGLFNELANDNRFDTVKLIPTNINEKGIVTKTDSISWGSIKTICEQNQVDAIFSLAYFETDTKLSLKKKKIEEQNMLRQIERVAGHEVTLETLIENGWRIYDPYNQQIIDELVFNDQITSKGKGTDPLAALDNITDRWNTVVDQSKSAGSSYGLRLLPQEQEMHRKYYVRGSDKLKLAQQLIIAENWEEASMIWHEEANNEDPKIKAKACYNMAFYNEKNEKYHAALDWINKSIHANSSSINIAYKMALENRIVNAEIVLQQLERSNLSASLQMN